MERSSCARKEDRTKKRANKNQALKKQLLQQVSGYIKPGQLVALMGSSGAGKTTLMDVLAQRKDSGRIQGSIMVRF